jgi:hypothetical protein
MERIEESYRRTGDDEDHFDIEFWQSQGNQAIFDAASEMVLDYLTISHGHAGEHRLQRAVEHFGKVDLVKTKEASGRDQEARELWGK